MVIEIDQDVMQWLAENKSVINHESLTLIEYMLYNEVSTKQISVRLVMEGDEGRLNLTVHPDEISITLDTIMKWALDEEEYEVCERVKHLTNIIEERENNESKN